MPGLSFVRARVPAELRGSVKPQDNRIGSPRWQEIAAVRGGLSFSLREPGNPTRRCVMSLKEAWREAMRLYRALRGKCAQVVTEDDADLFDRLVGQVVGA